MNADLKYGILSILHQNIQSLRNKISDLEVFIHNLKQLPQVICLTEHWFPGDTILSANLPNYRVASYSSRQTPHGGSCIYVSAETDFIDMDELKKFTAEGHCELCASISKKLKIIVISVYRPPSGDLHKFLELLALTLDHIRKYKNFKTVLSGDFNIDLATPSKNRKIFQDLLLTYNLEPQIHEFTHYIGDHHSLIDNIFVDGNQLCKGEVVKSYFSHHEAQIITLKGFVQVQCSSTTPPKRFFSESKIEDLKNDLKNIDWAHLLRFPNPNDAYEAFSKTVQGLIERIFTIKTTQPKKRKPWITTGIKTSSKRKILLYHLKNKNEISPEYYTKYSKIL